MALRRSLVPSVLLPVLLSTALLAACGGGDDAASTMPAAVVSADWSASGQTGSTGSTDAGASPVDGKENLVSRQLATRSTPGVDDITNYESGHVHPLDLTPDGQRLLAVNTARATLEIFDVGGDRPILRDVVPVGLEPVTVRAVDNRTAWVVNHASDTISVVDLVGAVVTRTFATADEPADVVFAGNPRRAFVSSAGDESVTMYDLAEPGTPLRRIGILGESPKSLAVSRDGSQVYVGIFESGNGTTALAARSNRLEGSVLLDPAGPYGGVNPPPNRGTSFSPALNPDNPPPPRALSLIVRRSTSGRWLDDNQGDWTALVTKDYGRYGRKAGWDLVDRDLAIIQAGSGEVSYRSGGLNIVMNVSVNPATGRVHAVGTEALNDIRFEPNLNGRFLRVLFSTFNSNSPIITDLNEHLTYTTPSVSPALRLQSVGDPRAMAWLRGGQQALVAGMGSNNVIVVDAEGHRVSGTNLIAVGRGPTGIAVDPVRPLAYVLNRFDASISVIDTDQRRVVSGASLSYDPTPPIVREGRRLLYDTHLSGPGHVSCASCHVDGKTDRLAWDLGNPAGAMTTVGGATHHPMKGALLTMTLVDTMQSRFLHWRGDTEGLDHFGQSFKNLMGAAQPMDVASMGVMRDFLKTLRTPPNPYRNLDNSFPTRVEMRGPGGTTLRVGDATLGWREFTGACRACHLGDNGRTGEFHQGGFSNGAPITVPKWQNFYKRDGLWFGDTKLSTSGFDILQDGSLDSTHNGSRSDNMMAFMYAFNGSFPTEPNPLPPETIAVDSHAAVGRQVDQWPSLAPSALLTSLDELSGRAQRKEIGLVMHGCRSGRPMAARRDRDGRWVTSDGQQTGDLAGLIQLPDYRSPLVFTAVRRGTERFSSTDEDGDGQDDVGQLRGPAFDRPCGTNRNVPVIEYVANGHFESAQVAAGAATTLSELPGWTSGSGQFEVWRNFSGWRAPYGVTTWLETDAGGRKDSVAQRLRTHAGQSLEISFWFAPRPGFNAETTGFEVRWNGSVVGRFGECGQVSSEPIWRQVRITVRAQGDDELSFAETGTNEGRGSLITAVSVQGIDPVNGAVNLSAGAVATQAGTYGGAEASRAIDGNTDGRYANGSVSHTAQLAQAWWQADLLGVRVLDRISLWNRTDCCSNRLSRFWVMVSDEDMSGRSLDELLADPSVAKTFHEGTVDRHVAVAAPRITGRYVRIQQTITAYLNLAEVEIWGRP